MKIRSLLIILLAVILIPLTLASDTQRRIKVYVTVREDDSTNVDERLEAFVKRELRALGDVDIVGKESDWDRIVTYDILEMTFKDGRKSGNVAIASCYYMPIAKGVLRDGYDEHATGDFRPVFWSYPHPAHWSVDNLHEFAIQNVAQIDKALESLRE